MGAYRAGMGYGLGAEGEPDGVDSAEVSSPGGFDGGSDVGVEGGGPGASEAVGDFPIGRTRPKRAFGAVGGSAERAVGDEDEQMAAGFDDDLDHLSTGVGVWGLCQDEAQSSDQLGLMECELGVVQFVSPPANGARRV